MNYMVANRRGYAYLQNNFHALRRIGAHYWLKRTNYNHVIVSRIGGWKSVQTLIDCYGQPGEDYIIKFLTYDNFGLHPNTVSSFASVMDHD